MTGKRIAKNTLWNLLGQGAPMLVAVITIPLIVSRLGLERFGILTLTWMVVGYFSLFDFGLGRALTQVVAERRGRGDPDESLAPAIWTSLMMMLFLGVSGTVLILAASHHLVTEVFKIPSSLYLEAEQSFFWLSFSIPFLTLTAGLKGLLEALDRFDYSNGLRIFLGLFNYLSPFLVFPFFIGTPRLDAVVAILVLGRLLFFGLHLGFALKALPSLISKIDFQPSLLKPLLLQGGWMTVSNVVGPIMVYFDRFILGAFAPMTVVAYYTTPYEVLTKIWIVPAAVMSALFPLFAEFTERGTLSELGALYSRGLRYVLILIAPALLIAFILVPWGLRLWLGHDFEEQSTAISRLLIIGLFVNSLAYVPVALLQATRRAHFIALAHLIELPFYLLGIWWFAKNGGAGNAAAVGVAFIWTLRSGIDTLFLMTLVHRLRIPLQIFPLFSQGEKEFLTKILRGRSRL